MWFSWGVPHSGQEMMAPDIITNVTNSFIQFNLSELVESQFSGMWSKVVSWTIMQYILPFHVCKLTVLSHDSAYVVTCKFNQLDTKLYVQDMQPTVNARLFRSATEFTGGCS